MTAFFSGSGPGVQTADGCSVEYYRRLPYLGELAPIEPLLPPRGTVLELGCGTGRLCTHLLERGLSVTGVDASREMLAALPPNVRPVQATIESLALNESFDAVLLASHLINHPNAATRAAFAAVAHRHLAAEGALFIQRFDDIWLRKARVGEYGRAGDALVSVESVHQAQAEERVSMTLRYDLGGQSWQHAFTVAPLSTEDVEAIVAPHGLRVTSWLGEKKTWAAVRHA
jgi:SAM-dependent methyltransferase